MNKSFITFLCGTFAGGTAIALLIVFGVLGNSQVTDQTSANMTSQNDASVIDGQASVIDGQLERFIQITSVLNTTIAKLERATAMLAGYQPAIIAPQEATHRTDINNTTAMMDAQLTPALSQPGIPVQPTSEQVEQFYNIQDSLYAAANNNAVNMSELVRVGQQLTPEQRDELTREAIDMIKRGELELKQFAGQPDS